MPRVMLCGSGQGSTGLSCFSETRPETTGPRPQVHRPCIRRLQLWLEIRAWLWALAPAALSEFANGNSIWELICHWGFTYLSFYSHFHHRLLMGHVWHAKVCQCFIFFAYKKRFPLRLELTKMSSSNLNCSWTIYVMPSWKGFSLLLVFTALTTRQGPCLRGQTCMKEKADQRTVTWCVPCVA